MVVLQVLGYLVVVVAEPLLFETDMDCEARKD
jgi:hypothetical protein